MRPCMCCDGLVCCGADIVDVTILERTSRRATSSTLPDRRAEFFFFSPLFLALFPTRTLALFGNFTADGLGCQTVQIYSGRVGMIDMYNGRCSNSLYSGLFIFGVLTKKWRMPGWVVGANPGHMKVNVGSERGRILVKGKWKGSKNT